MIDYRAKYKASIRDDRYLVVTPHTDIYDQIMNSFYSFVLELTGFIYRV